MEKLQEKDPNFKNIIIFSVGFMLLMAAWLTMAAIVQSLLYSIHVDDPSIEVDGFIAMTLVNAAFALTNFITPSIVSFVGVRTSLFFGTATYSVFIASFLYPKPWIIYPISVLLGIGAASVWVANGMYFTRSCNKDTLGKYMGIYWTIMCTGQLGGNAFVFWKFQGMDHIDSDTRFTVISVLTIIGVLSTLTFVFLGPPGGKKKDIESENEQKLEKATPSFCTTLLEPFALLRNKHMLLLIPPSIYNGLEIAFFMGIYPTAVGFTEKFGADARKLVGLAGIITGVGTVMAGLLFGVFGEIVCNSKRSRIIIFSCVSHCICCVLMFLNLPDESSFHPTHEISFIDPSVPIAMICALLLGIGDGCVSPQLGAAIAAIWPENPASALAIYRFFQAASCAAMFFISTFINFHEQLVIFLAVVLLGTATFCINEHLIGKRDLGLLKPVKQIAVMKAKLSLTNDKGKYKLEK